MSSKITTREELTQISEELRAAGKVIGYTSGVFDLLHSGHVDYLEQAHKQCDVLIVGLNSDSSVKSYKGENRPINSALDRAKVLAGLISVDYIFIFDERRNAENVKALKPNLYMKAGDYKPEALSSTPLVEQYGGKTVILPVSEGYGSTEIIERIVHAYCDSTHADPIEIEYEKSPAVFVDRDGVLNKEVEYLSDPKYFELLPGVVKALASIQEKGYRVIVVTNQPGIGLGYYERGDLFKVNKELLKALGPEGVVIDKIYYCPHSKSDNCECRKPGIGMLKRAERELNIDLKNSYLIGDMTSDIKAGADAGCKTILVQTGKAGKDGLYEVSPDFKARGIEEAVRFIAS